MLDHNAVISAMEVLRAEDFYRDVHRVIFEAMEHIHHDNREIDLITLPEELRRMKKLDAAGGLEYVMSLPNLVATAANIEYHSNIVKDKAMTRNLITTCNDLTTEAYDGGKMLKNSLMMQNGKYFILLKTNAMVIFLPYQLLSIRRWIRLRSSMKTRNP